MANVKNTTQKPLSIADDKGVIVISPSESAAIDDARLKELRKNKVVKSYFDNGYLTDGK